MTKTPIDSFADFTGLSSPTIPSICSTIGGLGVVSTTSAISSKPSGDAGLTTGFAGFNLSIKVLIFSTTLPLFLNNNTAPATTAATVNTFNTVCFDFFSSFCCGIAVAA